MEVIDYYSREVEHSVETWLNFTQADSDTRQQILALLRRELAGGEKTGMRPFLDRGAPMFLHTWGIVVGRKRSLG